MRIPAGNARKKIVMIKAYAKVVGTATKKAGEIVKVSAMIVGNANRTTVMKSRYAAIAGNVKKKYGKKCARNNVTEAAINVILMIQKSAVNVINASRRNKARYVRMSARMSAGHAIMKSAKASVKNVMSVILTNARKMNVRTVGNARKKNATARNSVQAAMSARTLYTKKSTHVNCPVTCARTVLTEGMMKRNTA